MKVFSLLLVCFFCVFCVSCEPKVIKINVNFESDGVTASFTNNDKFDYTDVDIKINDDYVVHVDKIASGETYTVAYRDFVNGDQRLNTITTQIQKIIILPVTPEGTAYEVE
jgi:hypothetical protein